MSSNIKVGDSFSITICFDLVEANECFGILISAIST